MSVDLSKAKAGDTVKFRCGGQAVIEEINLDPTHIYFVGYDKPYNYFLNGRRNNHRYSEAEKYPMDITEVIPAPESFDWSTAKAGMAFRFEGQVMVYHYIGNSIDKERGAVFQSKEGRLMFFRKEHLTRAPEHDVEDV